MGDVDNISISVHEMERWTSYTGRTQKHLRAELAQSIPFGGQLGNDSLRLLPSGFVAVIAKGRFVKTNLSREHAMANIQVGATGRRARQLAAGMTAQTTTMNEPLVPFGHMIDRAVRPAIGDRDEPTRRRERHEYSRGRQAAIAAYETAYRTCQIVLDNIRSAAGEPDVGPSQET